MVEQAKVLHATSGMDQIGEFVIADQRGFEPRPYE
jgi:hypothetical protein